MLQFIHPLHHFKVIAAIYNPASKCEPYSMIRFLSVKNLKIITNLKIIDICRNLLHLQETHNECHHVTSLKMKTSFYEEQRSSWIFIIGDNEFIQKTDIKN